MRLGVATSSDDDDERLVNTVFTFLEDVAIPFDQFFFDWFGGAASEARAMRGPVAEAYASERFAPLRDLFAKYTPRDPSRLDSPYFAQRAPCGLLIDEIEAIWSAIAAKDDWGPFDAKIAAIRAMGDATRATY
jgi:hypothetical protein